MTIFLNTFLNIIPLYVIIAIGFFAGRFFHLDRKGLANTSVYVLMPATLFGFVWQVDLKPEYFILPVIMLFMQGFFALTGLRLGQRIWKDNSSNLFALCVSMPNAGYFALPFVLFLFGDEVAAIYSIMFLGAVFFEATIGYYIAARSSFTVQQSIKEIIKFPSLYAVILGLALNYFNVDMTGKTFEYWSYFKGGYIIGGMMIIGVALSKMKRLEFGGGRFFSLLLIYKYILWPLLAFLIVYADRHLTHLLSEQLHSIILVVAILPPAANIAAFAAQLNMSPEKAATTIFIGTLIALLYIPAALWVMGINVSELN